MAWAGDQLGAAVAFRAIEAAMVNGTIARKQVEAVLQELAAKGYNLFIAAMLISRPVPSLSCIERFAWESGRGLVDPLPAHERLGPIYSGGGGSQDLVSALRSAAVATRPDASPRATATVACAISTALLSGEQMRANAGLDSLYGGGYEIATVEAGRIIKVGGITHFYLSAKRLDNGLIHIRVQRSITYDYQGELLLVGTLELQVDVLYTPGDLATTGRVARGSPAVYVILPVHRWLSAEQEATLRASPPDLSHSTKFTAIYIHCEQTGRVHCIGHYAGADTPALGIELQGDYLDVTVRDELLARISALC